MFGMWHSKLWTCCPESNHEKLFVFFYFFELINFFQNINPVTYSTPHRHIHIDFWQAPSHWHSKQWTCCPESNHEKLFVFFYFFKLINFFQNINPDTYYTPHRHIHIDFWQAPSHWHSKLWTCCPESNHEKLFVFFYFFELINFSKI